MKIIFNKEIQIWRKKLKNAHQKASSTKWIIGKIEYQGLKRSQSKQYIRVGKKSFFKYEQKILWDTMKRQDLRIKNTEGKDKDQHCNI